MHEEYIGKNISEMPDGSKVVVKVADGGEYVRVWRNGEAFFTNGITPTLEPHRLTVTHVLELGEPKPKVLADDDPWVAWEFRGCIVCHDGNGRTLEIINGKFVHDGEDWFSPANFALDDATRLGPIRVEVPDAK